MNKKISILNSMNDLNTINHDDVKAYYLKIIRNELENNTEIRDAISNFNPISKAHDKLITMLNSCEISKSFNENEVEYLNDSVRIILDELEIMRNGPKSLYLIDELSGKAIMALPDNSIYQPKDFIGIDGKLHKSSPVIHPGIASSIAIKLSEDWKKSTIIEKTKETSALALEHISNPNKMLRTIIQQLKKLRINSFLLNKTPENIIEFGREHIDGVFQSINPDFHRLHLFVEIVVKKICKISGKDSSIFLGNIEDHNNGKFRWYSIGFTIYKPNQLS